VSLIEQKQIVSLLMLLPFGLVVGTGILFTLFALRWSRRIKHPGRVIRINATADAPRKTSFLPSMFQQPSRWVAIKCQNLLLVQEALHMHDPIPCSWEEGLIEAREQKMFIAPPIDGWILVVGSGLPDPANDVDHCYHFLIQLSRRLGHVQYFTSNRALNHHGWALVDRGQVIRAYAWADETVWNQGPTTAAEKELHLKCFDYAVDTSAFPLRESLNLNAEKVNRLAAHWSLDPTAISEEVWNARWGIVGHCSHSRPH
jgi:hypothetical protein